VGTASQVLFSIFAPITSPYFTRVRIRTRLAARGDERFFWTSYQGNAVARGFEGSKTGQGRAGQGRAGQQHGRHGVITDPTALPLCALRSSGSYPGGLQPIDRGASYNGESNRRRDLTGYFVSAVARGRHPSHGWTARMHAPASAYRR
jgi:hypothetical protein